MRRFLWIPLAIVGGLAVGAMGEGSTSPGADADEIKAVERQLSRLPLGAVKGAGGWFTPEVSRAYHRSRIMLAEAEGDRKQVKRAGASLATLQELCAFRVTVESSGEARLRRGRGPLPGLAADVPVPFLVLLDNPRRVQASAAARSDGDVQCQMLSDTTVTPQDDWLLVVGILRCRQPGRRTLTLRVNEPTPSAPLECKLEVAAMAEATLSIRDQEGQPVWAAIEFRDVAGNAYPPPFDRAGGPDQRFQTQAYRTDGQTIRLPVGCVEVEASRGPEYGTVRRIIRMAPGASNRIDIVLSRWIDLPREGFYSGDDHVHAGTGRLFGPDRKGMTPEDLMAHTQGEDLHVCHLVRLNYTGETAEFQRRQFRADPDPLSRTNHILKYDVEVSGFPSSHLGHPLLLNLSRDDYPSNCTWNLPIVSWAKEQPGVIVGYAHPTFARYGFERPFNFSFCELGS